MPSKNTFNKGINQDLSKLKYQPDSYLEAWNFRVLTNDGLSSFALENTKGNKNVINLPTFLSIEWKININDSLGNVTFDINGTEIILNLSSFIDKTTFDLYNFLLNTEDPIFQSWLDDGKIGVFYNNSYVLIVFYDSTGSMTSIPDVVEAITSVVDNPFIIGWGIIGDEIVLLTTAKTNVTDDPVNTDGQIWKFKIDKVTGQVIRPNNTLIPFGDPLEPLYHLKYNNILNFSRYYEIYKNVKTRKESTEIGRVVWTDFNMDLRTINIYDPQVQAVPVELLSYKPIHVLQQPLIRQVVEGGFIPSCKIQFFYRYGSNQGAFSTYSPLSNLLDLTPSSLTDFQNTQGGTIGASSTKSVNIEVLNPDTNYDIIQFGYTIYQVKDVPESFIYEQKIIYPDGRPITSSFNGSENDIPVPTIEELANVNRTPDTFKTIETVDNYLLAANAKTRLFDVEFDARAYRFNSLADGREAKLYSGDQTHSDTPANQLNGASGTLVTDMLAIPDTDDLINPYNDESFSNPFIAPGGTWVNNLQYKYQADGVTLGGQGPNISYEFVKKELYLDMTADIPSRSPFYTTSINNNLDYTNKPYDEVISGSFNNMASPYFSAQFMGYARGEVYRFAIVFYNKYGYTSFAKWIGDIKFPQVGDPGYHLTDIEYGPGATEGIQVGYQLGIKFLVDTSSAQFQAIKDEIVGWSIVRMKRNIQDKTKFGIGPIHRTVKNASPDEIANVPFYLIGQLTTAPFGTQNHKPRDFSFIRSNIATFNIPNFDFDIDVNFSNNDHLKVIAKRDFGYTVDSLSSPKDTATIQQVDGNPDSQGESAYGKYRYLNSDYEPLTKNCLYTNIQKLKKSWRVDRPKPGANVVPADTGNGLTDPYRNAVRRDSEPEYRTAGNKTTLCTFDGNIVGTGTFNMFDVGTGYDGTGIGVSEGDPSALKANILWLVSYERYLNKQYGGNIRTARYGNEYISTGHFQPYNLDDAIGYKEVWGGDTNVQFYGYAKFEKNYENTANRPTGLIEPSTSADRCRIYFIAPCECSNLNVDLAQGVRVNRFSLAANADSTLFEDYNFNKVYSQEQFINRYFSKFLNQTDVIEEPHNIYITDPKFDNQRVDSWRFFRVNNTLGVDGNFGPINKIIEQNGKLIFLQEDAVGIAAINERIQINEGDTTAITLGTGQPLQRADYLSTETGTIHQHSVEKTGSGIYHYDSKLQKIMITSFTKDGAGTISLSDQLGLSSFLRNNINGRIKNTDKLLLEERYGAHTIYHPEHAQVYFTFIMNNEYITVTYNEYLKMFDSFHNIDPSMYLNTRYGLYSIYFDKQSPFSNHTKIYQHNVGNYNEYYGQLYPSSVKILSNENPDFLKRWDNLYVNTEVYNNLNENVLESLTKVRFTNDYQDSGLITFNADLIPKLRVWRFNKLRDTLLNPTIKPRLSDKFIISDLIYDNPNNRRIVLHDILMEYSSRSTLNNTIK
jgi:hypothetical protein